MITVTDLSKTFGTRDLFRDCSLQLDAGKRYGIVGANGSGKSTLLRILTGDETASTGTITMPRNARVGVLSQDHFAYEQTRILDVVMMGNKVLWDAMVEKEALLENAGEHFDADRYSQLEDIVLAHDGYGLPARAGEILEGLGVPTSVHEQPLAVLSGGFKLRVLLGQTLASDPDILFLDEPTNHLDILAIAWLEQFLLSFSGCAVVVSHDHRFLDAACTHIIDVDYERVIVYPGNYSRFVVRKEEERARAETEIAAREKEIADHKAFIDRFKAKASKARQANSRQKRMERIELTELPRSSRRHPHFLFKARRPSGREVVAVEGLWKSFPDPGTGDDKVVLADVTFKVHRGERVALIGRNGIGKSTLLKIMMDQLAADDGDVRWGHETDVGYFPQDHHEVLVDTEQAVSSALWDACPTEGLGQIMARLAAVLFTRDDADKKVGVLSGGEAARLMFARISAPEPTVMVLDEPTNHLDLEGIEALSHALKQYDGTLVFVSHDRWFVDQLATRVIELTDEGVVDYPGSYQEFLARHHTDHLDAAEVVARDRDQRRKQRKRK
ncbi:MAG: ABC-F family ATP-binding cassette domain-containing protein [Alphaproteobacteria bacterium]|nr:ABC-F family ATP-binding cassette domain-containing protein [Alphaproteobacteria bacterium]